MLSRNGIEKTAGQSYGVLKKNIGVSSASHGPLLVDPAHCMIVVRQWMRCSSAE